MPAKRPKRSDLPNAAFRLGASDPGRVRVPSRTTLRESPLSDDKVIDTRLIVLAGVGIIAAGAAIASRRKGGLKDFATSLKEALPKPAGPRPK